MTSRLDTPSAPTTDSAGKANRDNLEGGNPASVQGTVAEAAFF